MKNRVVTTLVAFMYLSLSFFAVSVQAKSQAQTDTESSKSQSCQFDIKFFAKPIKKNQKIALAPNISMELAQYVATKVESDIKIASNVICQHLIGHSYTGTEQEFTSFIENGINGLLKAGFKDLQYTLVGDNDATYRGKLDNIEYTFTGDNNGNKQVIHNLTILDKKQNQVITISVSGNERVADKIKEEYTNLVESFSL